MNWVCVLLLLGVSSAGVLWAGHTQSYEESGPAGVHDESDSPYGPYLHPHRPKENRVSNPPVGNESLRSELIKTSGVLQSSSGDIEAAPGTAELTGFERERLKPVRSEAYSDADDYDFLLRLAHQLNLPHITHTINGILRKVKRSPSYPVQFGRLGQPEADYLTTLSDNLNDPAVKARLQKIIDKIPH